MELVTWRTQAGLSRAELAERLGIAGARGESAVWNWETGRARPDADMVARIEAVTGGAVTAQDMHAVRLAWLRENRPEKFMPATEAAE